MAAMTVGAARFGSSSGAAFESIGRGSCVENARRVAADSPTGRPFALPHKRFVHPTVDQKCRIFLGEEIGYRQAVWDEGRPIVYDEPPKGRETSAALAPSTLWRWLHWLGGLKKTTQKAFRVIREANASATLHREAWAVSPSKYRSDPRKEVLQEALRLLVVQEVFRRQVGNPIFPHFATGCGWS